MLEENEKEKSKKLIIEEKERAEDIAA